MRLGRISYVNMAPVFYRLEADVEEVTGVPTELSRMLLDGEIDIAPIPSIEYARNADRLRILPRAVRLVRGRGRLDPARHAAAVRPGPLGRGDAGERDVGRAHAHPAAEGGDPPARDGGGRDAADRRRGAAERVRGPDAALRPRPALARADRAADGVRRLGGARARRRGPASSSSTRSSRPCGSRARSRSASRSRRARRTATRRASSPATSRSSATASGRASARASTRSSRWRATSASSTTCPSSASCARRSPA